MNPPNAHTLYKSHRAPRDSGSAVVDPPLEHAPQLLTENRDRAHRWNLTFAGQSIQQLRDQARSELVAAAEKYTSAYRDIRWVQQAPSTPLILAGHQPTLFHPGVWFKNFALSHLGKSLGATAINLVIDSDLRENANIRVPQRDASGRMVAESVPIDRSDATIPYEQHRIKDRNIFNAFDTQVAKAVSSLVTSPCVNPLWHHARLAADRCQNTGCAVAQARHALEGDLGLQTLELPFSVVCRSRSFAVFTLGLLQDLAHLHDCYNQSVNEYRKIHGIRSRAHPVPNLGTQGDWREVPFWIYGDEDPVRRAAWVRSLKKGLEISDLNGRSLYIDSQLDQESAVDKLQNQLSSNFKLRSRALVTTMYARLVLSDLFLHGIGGGKYDQLGDTIAMRMFGIEPPTFCVLSATVLLPGVKQYIGSNGMRQITQRIRETYFHPETFVKDVALDENLLTQKQTLLENIPQRGQKSDWHRQLTEVNQELSHSLDKLREHLRREGRLATMQRREAQLLASREHPFCVFPLEYLQEIYAKLLPT